MLSLKRDSAVVLLILHSTSTCNITSTRHCHKTSACLREYIADVGLQSKVVVQLASLVPRPGPGNEAIAQHSYSSENNQQSMTL